MAGAVRVGMLPLFAAVAVLGSLAAAAGWRFPAVEMTRRGATAGGAE